MANQVLNISGTAKVFKAAGGDAAITLASLADGAARQSAKLDFGATRGVSYSVFPEMETGGAAPAAGAAIILPRVNSVAMAATRSTMLVMVL